MKTHGFPEQTYLKTHAFVYHVYVYYVCIAGVACVCCVCCGAGAGADV